MVITSHLSTEQADLQSHLRETEVFIQVNSPGTASESLAEAPSLAPNLGTTGGMVLPTTRAKFTGTTVGFDILAAANSGKSVDERKIWEI